MANVLYDLHCHSKFSPDAELEPLKLFSQAKKAGLRGLAVTDHNTVSNFDEVAAAARATGLWTCQATEITASYQGVDIHVHGYSYNFDQSVLGRGLRSTIDGYNERSRKIAQKVNQLGIASLNFEAILESKKDSFVSKVNVAQAIAQQKNIPYREAIKLLERDGPAFIPYGSWAMSPKQAIELIHRASGIAVIAHPGDFAKRGGVTEQEGVKMITKLIKDLVALGLQGIEAHYPRHSKTTEHHLLKLAASHGLLVTGGSDFHGSNTNTEDTELGDAGINQSEWQKLDRVISATK